MFCSNCGGNLADNAQFCPKCGTRIAQSSDSGFAQQPVEKKRCGKLWIILSAVAMLGVAGALLILFLSRDENPYQHIFKAIGNTVRMDSAEITAYDEYHDDYEDYSFCIDPNSEALQYYLTQDGERVVQGFYDGYYFRCRDNGGSDVSGSKWKLSQSMGELASSAILQVCAGKDIKSFARAYVAPLISSSATRREQNREASDIAELRSVYAELMTYALLEEEMETERAVGNKTFLPASRDEAGKLVYSANIKMTQTQPGWQSSYVPSIGEAVLLSELQPGPVATMTLRYPYEKVELTFSNDAFMSDPSDDLSDQSIDFEKIVDVLEEKLTDEEWMSQVFELERTSNGKEAVYNLEFRPRKLLKNLMDEIDDYLDNESKGELKDAISDVENVEIDLQFAILDDKISQLKSNQLSFELNLEYKNDKLSELRFETKENRVYEISFSKVDQVKFDQSYVKELLSNCVEWG